MRTNFKPAIYGLLFQCLLLSACESKFIETPPDDSDNGATQSLNDRVSKKGSLDSELAHLSGMVSKTKRIFQLFQRFQKNSDRLLYSEIDLLSDITTEFKKGVPDAQEGSYVGVAHVNLPLTNLSPECRKVDAQLKTLGASVDDTTERATISLKTCETNGQYVETFVLGSQNGNIESIQITDDAIRSLFPSQVEAIDKVTQLCDFTKDENGKIQQVTCQNLKIPINSIDTAMLDSLTFDSSGDIRLAAQGRILEKGKPDLGISLAIDKNLMPREFNIAPIASAPPGTAALTGQL